MAATDFLIKEKDEQIQALVNALQISLAEPLPHPSKDTPQRPNPNTPPSSPWGPGQSPAPSRDDKLVHGRHHPGFKLPTGRKIRPSDTHDKDSRVHQRYIMDDYGGQIKNPDYVPYTSEDRILDILESIQIKPEMQKILTIPELDKMMDMMNGLQIQANHQDLTDLLSPHQDNKGSLKDSGLSPEQIRELLNRGVGAYKRA